MFRLFKPDLHLSNIYELPVELLVSKGIRVLVADLDNTIAAYEHLDPQDEVKAWVKALADSGISLAVVSNNKLERVERYCKPLGVHYYWKSGKPSRKTILSAMEKLGGTRETTALIGDKYITDILGAKRSGVFAIKVNPIGKRRMFE